LGHPGRIDGTRELVIPDTRYIVPYRVMPQLNRVEILRVFHASRKLPESW
jgi:toxin ParE1/3/4